ncbi:hypothetical protein GGS20DRAFT_573402 [Poronia punctata]|nr:hypothetical protein GGS20DRAFT_573402 [Poronia punctata]
MKFSARVVLALLGASATTVLAREITQELIDECGRKENVMIPPPGANETEYRHCSNHPLGDAKAHVTRALGLTNNLNKRDCWFGSNTGCTNGYCWKRCGADISQGNWCWTAIGNDGKGDWYQCAADNQCFDYMTCGQASGGDCPDCGCDCRDKGA